MPIELHTWNTPNGRKISVALEEMGLPYSVHPINISKGEQFAPEFLKISPNNRIPAIVDPEGPGGAPISVFEFGRDPDLSRREDRQVLAQRRSAPAGAGARVADVADGRVRPDAGTGPPLSAGQGRERPPLRARALHQGDPPALRSIRQAAWRGRNSPAATRSRSPISRSSAGPGDTSGTSSTSPIIPMSNAGTKR